MIPEPRVDLKLLHSFVAVAETLHFGKAAEQSFLSVGTISTRIKDLEQRLGYPVFVRTSREVSLTPKGSELLAEIRPLLEAVSKIGNTSGLNLTLACNIDCMIPAVFAAIERMKANGAEIEVRTAYDHEARQLLEAGSIDLAVGWSDLSNDDDTCRTRRLLILPVFAYLKSDDPLVVRDVITPGDLVGHEIVLFERTLAPDVYDAVTGWLEQAERSTSGYTMPIFSSQAGMAGTAAARTQAATLGTERPPSDAVVWRPMEPSLGTAIWATTRSADAVLLAEFEALVREY